MRKKLITATIFIISIAFGWFAYTNLYPAQNLRRYSVYYAHNMEHKRGTHPEMAMALENIKVIHTPGSKGIRYDYDGLAKVYNERNKNNGIVPSICATYNQKNTEYLYISPDNNSYIFNADFTLKIVYNHDSANLDPEKSDIDEEELYKEVYNNFGFLVEANVNRKPLINMQKEFNKKYYKRFN